MTKITVDQILEAMDGMTPAELSSIVAEGYAQLFAVDGQQGFEAANRALRSRMDSVEYEELVAHWDDASTSI